MKALSIVLIPRITDKSYNLSKKRVYVFKVPTTVNKHEIAEAVSKQYDVKVLDVKTVIAKAKVKSVIRKGRPMSVKGSDFKKAYVTLTEGQSIKMFEEEQ